MGGVGDQAPLNPSDPNVMQGSRCIHSGLCMHDESLKYVQFTTQLLKLLTFHNFTE